MNALNYLVAEDRADEVVLLEHAFKKAGVAGALYSVSDGHEAIAYLKGDGVYADRAMYPVPDVLLLDLNMPRVNGFEVLEWTRKTPEYGQLVIYVLTASARDQDIKRAYGLGANSYIVKPSRFDELKALAAALQQWHHCITLPPRNGAARRLDNAHSGVTVQQHA